MRCSIGLIVLVLPVLAAASGLSAARRAELSNLLHQDCGACHGNRLTGGLGPALTSAALAAKSATQVETIIAEGRPGTPMPPWKNLLSTEEIRWLVARMLSGAEDPR